MVVLRRDKYKNVRTENIFQNDLFDEDCCNIRRQIDFVKNLKERFPHNHEIREQFYAIKRIFDKSVKKNKAAVNDELLNKLNNFHDKDTQKH